MRYEIGSWARESGARICVDAAQFWDDGAGFLGDSKGSEMAGEGGF